MMKRGVIWVLVSLALAGCATVPMASPDRDRAAKQFTPDAGKANVYVARGGSGVGAAVTFDVKIDGTKVSKLAAATYFMISVDPGQHVISASSVENTSSATMVAEAGKNYFYEVTAQPGLLSAHADLKLVLLEPMGKFMVQQYQLAKPVTP